jgi:RNA polymerase sigma-70 factor, ECF subfamily
MVTLSSEWRRRVEATCDDALLAAILGGDAQALALLYDRYGRLIFTLALRITGDRLSAEEVTQDVFHVVWERAAAFCPASGTLCGWMIGIARHRAINEVRSRPHRMRRREVSSDELAERHVDASEDVAQQVVLCSDIRAALAGLPPAQRDAIELAYYAGLTCSEIACSLDTPIGTIKTRLRLGLLKLRSTLGPGEDQGAARPIM